MIIFFAFILNFVLTSVVAQTQAKPLYELKSIIKKENIDDRDFLVGNDKGLYKITDKNIVVELWSEGKVKQIFKTTSEVDKSVQWYFVTSKGILFSSDLEKFELRNNGLPKLVIHHYENGTSSYIEQMEDLKDFSINPLNSSQIVTATKDNVYISYNSGENWSSLGSMSKNTAGIKAVAIVDMALKNTDGTVKSSDLVVFMSHPVFGLSYILPKTKKPVWTDVDSGFEIMKSLSNVDEISDILPVVRCDSNGNKFVEIFLAQTFLPNIYRFDWDNKKAVLIYKGKEPSDSIDSLVSFENGLLFVTPSCVKELEYKNLEDVSVCQTCKMPLKFEEWNKKFLRVLPSVNSAWIPKSLSGYEIGFALNELWLVSANKTDSKYDDKIHGKKSIYVPPYQVRKQLGKDGIEKFVSIVKENNLNSVVIDMKDDYGLLRYETKDPLVMEKASVSQYATDIDEFIELFKKENVYLIARLVVFKDRNLARYAGGKYSVWDSSTQKQWLGIKGYEEKVDENTKEVIGKETLYYDETWVDPYCAEVWEYNVAIAKELVRRGFDEIQFDYIRFPTDGLNLRNAKFRWKTDNMEKENALISFLSYARQNIDAPIGIDIYGANGWYRTGSRTGQDVEMLSNYVDVICPMFYPSHFRNDFLNYKPFAERPYRIYFYGSFRNTIIGRNKIVVRPWVQAFRLGVSYDKQYYGVDYVRQQIFGIRDSIDNGYMYWNNLGNYEYIREDIGNKIYNGETPESSMEFRKPTFSNSLKQLKLFDK